MSHCTPTAIALLLCLPMVLSAGEAVKTRKPDTGKPDRTWAPTADYVEHTIEGWRVLVHQDFPKGEPELCERTLRHLRHQLYQIPHKVPAPAVKKLRQVTLWVEENEGHHACMAFHPNPNWLREHDMNPDKAPCVEIANARHFLSWTQEQPWMVLHELAHAYHFSFLDGGYGNTEIRAAYERAKKAKLYQSALHWNGAKKQAYAMTNPMEYFAETSEAFFGTNDIYPFVNAELKAYDPEMHALLVKLWGVESRKLK